MIFFCFLMRWYLALCLPGLAWAEPLSMPSQGEIKFPMGSLNNLSRAEGISCKDILVNNKTFSDADVTLVFQHVFTLCTMEISMQKYIEYAENLEEKDDEIIKKTKKELANLQKILPTFLNAFKITSDMFAKKGLREKLNEKLNEYREMHSLDDPQ